MNTIIKIEDTLNKIDNTDFYVNKSQNNYHPIERYILVGDNYLSCGYKTSHWIVNCVVHKNDIIMHLINKGYVKGLPTNSFEDASYRCREYDWQRELDIKQFGGYKMTDKFRFHFENFLYDKQDITFELVNIKISEGKI